MLPPIAPPNNTEAEPSPPPAPVLGYDSPIDAGNSSATVWFRILAVWIFACAIHDAIAAIGQLPAYFYHGSRGRFLDLIWEILIPVGLPSICWFLMAWYCWAHAPRMARRASIGVGVANPASISAEELLGVLLSGVGVWLFGLGLAIGGRYLFDIMVWRPQQSNQSLRDFAPGLFDAALRILIGVWLILGNRGVVNLIRRHSGRWKIESNAAQPNAQDPQVHP
jgi:hypothetical protein